jgi:dTDP-4-dehydrorhamnose reductase
MRLLLLGKVGQLGWELCRTLAPLGHVIALDYPEIDLAKPHSLAALVDEVRPAVIINATAYTAVDRAESEQPLAMAINGSAPGILAEAARRHRAALLHFSTDYVFDGQKGSPYLETDTPNPLSVYGGSKLAGEQAIAQAGDAWLILRTSWVYSLRRDSFVTKVLAWARTQPTIRIVDDQISNPTWARMLAEVTAQMLAKALTGDLSGGQAVSSPAIVDWLHARRGLYHLAGSGYASRLEWARAILRLDPQPDEHVLQELLSAQTIEFPTPARRPLFSALNCDKFVHTFGLILPDWEAALQLAMAT